MSVLVSILCSLSRCMRCTTHTTVSRVSQQKTCRCKGRSERQPVVSRKLCDGCNNKRKLMFKHCLNTVQTCFSKFWLQPLNSCLDTKSWHSNLLLNQRVFCSLALSTVVCPVHFSQHPRLHRALTVWQQRTETGTSDEAATSPKGTLEFQP